MLATRTGNFPIGFRRLYSLWQKDSASLILWAREQKFSLIDLGRDADQSAPPFRDAGLHFGSADLPEWNALISSDPARRQEAIQKNTAYIRVCSKLSIGNFFLVALPENPAAPRHENFSLMIDSFNALASALQETDSRIVIEGWPGPGALCCTPETIRATFKACPSPRIGLNYDPSHLLRMGINPVRFLEEFVDRVYHIHGKDTEILTENLYEYGHEQPPTFGKPRGFGGSTWRYTIPGRGQFQWTRALEILTARNYQGAVSIELEDENFNGSESGEKQGLIAAAQCLAAC